MRPLLVLRPPGGSAIVTALVLAVALAFAVSAQGAEWGTIIPGTSTMESVRAMYGAPSKTTTTKIDGYDSTEWVYEGTRTPRGIRRLIVDFGLLRSSVYKPDVVRTFTLEPRSGIFQKKAVLSGWGEPSSEGRQGDVPYYFYEEGLFVFFDKDGWEAERLVFTLPQPLAPRPAERKP
jgi:hypothetical protein